MCLALLIGTAFADSTSTMTKEITVTGSAPVTPAPTVTSITPATGQNTGTVSITDLAGTGFVTGATVNLTKTGQTNITATSVSVVTANQITCTVDLTGKAAGTWNVVVTNPDSQTGTLANGFTVTSSTGAPTVTSITPATGQNTGTVSITDLAGTGFVTGATVNLTKTGQTNITATSVSVVTANQITCTIDLTGKVVGQWNVVVTNPDSQTGTLANGFTVNVPAPVAPVASFNYNPTTIKMNDVVSFDASASNPYGTLTKYEWNFGDNTITSSSTPTITHVYTQSQVYSVTLTVTDANLLTNSTRQQLEVKAKTETFNSNIDGTTVQTSATGTQMIQVDKTTTKGTVTVSEATNSVVIDNPGNGWSQVTYVNSVPITTTSSGNLNLGAVSQVIMKTVPITAVLNQSTVGTVTSSVTIPMKQLLTTVTISQSITEGVSTSVANAFQLAAGNNLNVDAVAYTVQFQNTALIDKELTGASDPVQLKLSVLHSWVVANAQGDRSNIRIMRLADDGTNEMLPTRYVESTPDPLTDFFIADSKNGLSTFGISAVSSTGSAGGSSSSSSGVVDGGSNSMPVQSGQSGQGIATASEALAGQTVSYSFGTPSATNPVSIQSVSLIPGETVPQSQCVVLQQGPPSALSLTDRPAAYASIQISPINPDVITSGTIHFSVLGSWLSEKQIDPANVVLLRSHDLVWTELPTSFDHADGDNYYYYTDTPGFAYFAVSEGHPTPAKVTSQTTVSLSEEGEPVSPPVTGTAVTIPGLIKPAPESMIPAPDSTLYTAVIILICAAGAIYLIIRKIPHKTRVLIVDDEPQICEVLSLILKAKSYKTTKASSGEECLSLLKNKKNHPDAILLDITMYPMDGWKTLEKMKKDPALKNIPVLMLTGKQLAPEEAKRYGICIEDYIHKPVLAQELYGAIEYVLNRKKKIAGEIQMAIRAGNDKTLVCEYAKLAKQTDVEKKLLEHIRTTYTSMGTKKHEILGSIEDLANDIQRREETMIQLRQRFSVPPVSSPVLDEDVA